MVEIERKFLITKNSPLLPIKNLYSISQYYIKIDETKELRLRIKSQDREQKYILGEKKYTNKLFSKCSYLKRIESEIEIPKQVAEILLNFSEKELHKDRGTLNCDSIEFTIDTYKWPQKGLVIAEIEFRTEQEAAEFRPSKYSWLGKEITWNPHYLGKNLAKSH